MSSAASDEVTAALTGAVVVALPKGGAVPEGAKGGGRARYRPKAGQEAGPRIKSGETDKGGDKGAEAEPPAHDPEASKGGGPFDQAASAGGGKGGRILRKGLPEGCPVQPLGTHNGTFYYLDTVGQLRDLRARDHGRTDILALFAPHTDLLYATWPRTNDKGVTTGWRPELVSEELMKACAEAGVWNAMDKVRGRGAWLDPAGGLILHLGNAVMMGGEWKPTGLHDGFVYPAAPALPRPTGGWVSADIVEEALAKIQSWNWARRGLDEFLLLGWLGLAQIPGAFPWRPAVWVTGDAGTGKSTLQALIKGLVGDGLLQTTDASEAGIRQTLGQQSLPVAIDEAEADDDNRKMQGLIKLARASASGGSSVRGGSDHNAQQFVTRACFLLSSILIPPLKGQDRSRLAILDLLPLPKGGAEPALDAEWLRRARGAFAARMVAGYPRFAATLLVYRDMLKAAGHGGRGADQFGTLLACADLLQFDTVPTAESVAEMAGMLAADALAETASNVSDSERCLSHLLTSTVTIDGGSKPQTLAHWIDLASRQIDKVLLPDDVPDQTAARGLAVYGLRVERDRAGGKWLAVAGSHQGLARLFQNSHWQSQSGAAGVWGQSLARLPEARTNQNVRISGKCTKCVRLPLALALDEGLEEEF